MSSHLSDSSVLLDVQHLRTYFPVRGGLFGRRVGWVRAVDDVSFGVKSGETFGLVGESGCGKTTIGRSIVRLTRPQSGKILFEREDLLSVSRRRLKQLRAEIQIIFQDPYGSLDPRMTAGEIVAEGLRAQGVTDSRDRDRRVANALHAVGLTTAQSSRYPHEFSGGQRQRIGIARALALRPRFIVADEPVSALDVSIQSQVLNLLSDLQNEFGLTYLFIAHDLSVVEHISDRVGVMYLGRLVEVASSMDLYANPRMPYTQALLSAVPNPDPAVKRDRIVIEGEVPSPINPPSGCPFRTRCWLAQSVCAERAPALRQITADHWAACHFA